MRTLISLAVASALGFTPLLFTPQALAADTAASSDQAKIERLQQKIDELSEELADLDSRVNKTERHTALDRITFSGDFRTKAHSLHYRDVTWNPGIKMNFDDFGRRAMAGEYGDPMDPTSPLGKMMTANPDMAAAFMAGQLSGVMPWALGSKQSYDIDNDLYYTTRLRLDIKAKVWDNVNFAGRLAMYKN